MNMIKNLIFDFGKVLVDYDFERFFSMHIADEKRRDELFRIMCCGDLQEELDKELTDFDNIVDAFILKHPDFEPEIRIFQACYEDVVTGEVEGMRQLLIRLKSAGYKLYGLTNWCSKVHNTMRQYDIFRLLDGQVVSSEEHVIKPDPEIYQIIMNRYHLLPSESVFTDDKLENVDAAIALGMYGIHFQNAIQYEKELGKIVNM